MLKLSWNYCLSKSHFSYAKECFGKCPPAQNQYMQEKNLGELIFRRIHAGPVFALARIQENIFEESFSAY